MTTRCAGRCIVATVVSAEAIDMRTTCRKRRAPVFTESWDCTEAHAPADFHDAATFALLRVLRALELVIPDRAEFPVFPLESQKSEFYDGTIETFRLSRQGGSETNKHRRLDHLSGKSHLKEIAQ